MKIITDAQVQQWLYADGLLAAGRRASQGLGRYRPGRRYLGRLLDLPASLSFALEVLLEEDPQAPADALDAIPLFSLFKGLYLPLAGLDPTKVAYLFGLRWQLPPQSPHAIIARFLTRPLGLTLSEKVGCLMGDPYMGKPAYLGQDTLIQVLASLCLASPRQLRQQLAQVGDIGMLFSQQTTRLRSEPPIGAREALLCLRYLPRQRFNLKKEIIRDLLERSGRLERYFLVRLMLRRLNFGYHYRTDLITSVLAQQWNIAQEQLDNAIGLTDIFTVARILEKEGAAGLQKLVLTPLHPVSPALASNNTLTAQTKFPLWFERKYDGIRLMLHKDTGSRGEVLCAAFTRRKNDWLALIPGLASSIEHIPAYAIIMDGELYADILDETRVRPATVYEIYRSLQGTSGEVLKLKYAAFDILYLNGHDLTALPFLKRRQILEQLLGSLQNYPLPVPLVLAEGKNVQSLSEANKLFAYFRGQGYEGGIAKRNDAPYLLGKRSNDWIKKKPAITLDLVICGAIWSTGDRGPMTFSSYLIACQDNGQLKEIGRVQGLDRESNGAIIQRIVSEGLLTGRMLERRAGQALQAGVELAPAIVVTVRFEGVIRDSQQNYGLRDPKIVVVRPSGEKPVSEIDTLDHIRQLYLKQRL